MYCQDSEKCNGSSDSAFAEPCDDEIGARDVVVMRKNRYKKRRSTARLSVINGHLYEAEVVPLMAHWLSLSLIHI